LGDIFILVLWGHYHFGATFFKWVVPLILATLLLQKIIFHKYGFFLPGEVCWGCWAMSS